MLSSGAVLAVAALAFASPVAAWASAYLLCAAAGALLVRAPTGHARRVHLDRTAEAGLLDVQVEATLRGRQPTLINDLQEDTVEVHGKSNIAVAKGSTTLAYTVRPSRFGLQRIGPLVAQRSDALGLRIDRRSLADATDVTVTPRTEKTQRTPFRSKVPSILLGGHLVQRAGSGSEFLSLRDYQAGDAMRMVNWKASARSPQLVVNQRVHESPTELTIFLDRRSVSDAGPAASSPYAVGARAASSILAGAVRSRDRARIVLYGDGVEQVRGRGTDMQRRLEDLLSATAPAGTTCLADAVGSLLTDLRPGRPVVVITCGEGDATTADALFLLRQRATRPFLVCPPNWGGDGAAGEAAVHERQALVGRLRAAGFPVFEAADGVPLEDLFRIQGAA